MALNTPPGPIDIATLAAGVLVFAGLVFFSLVSSAEKERRAARRAFLLAWVLAAPFFVVGLVSFPYQTAAAGALLASTAVLAAALLVPSSPPAPVVSDRAKTRIDERDTMFSRRDLEPGTARFDDYYRRNPEKKALDDAFRSKPGLLGEGALYDDPVMFAASKASFETIESVWPLVDGEPSRKERDADPADLSRFIEEWARHLGAVSAGITELRDEHLYSVAGRRERYGVPVRTDHTHAIAIAVEMDKTMVASAPHAPTVMESSQQYVAAGVIAVQVAQFIRNIGYSARAHVDGNYLVVCPLVARDAGLGEIGRMGLLMTPSLGPRVRLSVVTTDAPLVSGRKQPRADTTMGDFCSRCRKCAAACPSRAISFEAPREIDGAFRWRIDSEACYTYWCASGTDCARCIAVCPYSHPDTLVHRVARSGVRRSALFRRLALSLDDFFYGKRPPSSDPPEWTRVKTGGPV